VFHVEVDGAIIGTGTAGSYISNYIFTAQLAPHQVHRIAIGLTNGANTATSTTAHNNLALFVNNSAVNLVDPEAQGSYGAYGFVVGNNAQLVTNFSATHNILYRNGGESQDIYPPSVASISVRSGSKVTRNPSWLQNRLSSPITSGLVLLVVRSKISLLPPSHRLAASCAMATHRSARYVQLAKSAIESRVVGVASTVRGGHMRSSRQKISSFDSNSSGTQSIARSASRTASSIVETNRTSASLSGPKASGPN
jgi:hypothetical protein